MQNNMNKIKWIFVVCILAHMITCVTGQELSMLDSTGEDFSVKIVKAAILVKLLVLVMLTQLGKTFEVVEHIKKDLEEYDDSLSIIYTMNTLLNNKQFAHRLIDFKELYGRNSIVIFSSKQTTNEYIHCRTITELHGILNHPDEDMRPKIIVMCSNPTRFKNILTSGSGLISILDKKITDGSCYYKSLRLYFDEMHEYISQIRTMIEKIIVLNSVKSIVGTTATPGQIWCSKDCWTSFTEIDITHVNTHNYVGSSEMIWRPRDDLFNMSEYRPMRPFDEQRDKDVLSIITKTLDMFPDILSDNHYCFIPGGIRQVYHRKIRDLIFLKKKDAVVVLINGTQKCVSFYNNGSETMSQIPLAESGEVSNDIATIVDNFNLDNRCLVVTGHLCIGMGQTLTCERLGNFTHSIIGNIDLDNDKCYQLFGRLTGRCKGWDKYTPTTIYCPSVIMDRVFAMEKCAYAMMKNSDNNQITHDQYIRPMLEAFDNGSIRNKENVVNNFKQEKLKKEKKTSRYPEENYERNFHTGTEEYIYGLAKSMTFNCNKLPKPKDKDKDENGCYKISGPGCQAGMKRVYSSKELADHAYKGSLGSHLDTAIKNLEIGKYSKRRYICYEDVKDPSTMKYCLVSVKRPV